MNPTVSRGFIARAVPGGWLYVFLMLTLIMAMVIAAPGAYAAKGSPGPSATVTGHVMNNYSQSLAGASVTFKALTTSYSTVTDGSGNYTIKVPANASYDVSVSAANHATYMVTGSAIKGKNNPPLNVTLQAVARVVVSASVSNGAGPGDTVTATGSYTILDGSSFSGTDWSYVGDGVVPVISSPNSGTTQVTFGAEGAYKDHLIQVLKDPPITAADLPPNLNLQPINSIQKGLQNRYQVVGIDPKANEEAEIVPLKFSVTTGSGTYSASVNAVTHLPWVVNPGVKTVPTNVPVLLYGKDAASYSWSITVAPGTSTAALTDDTTQAPWFTPDVVGTYEIVESVSGTTLQVNVGRYHGVIDPTLTLLALAGGDDRPVADPNCTGCHTVGGAAPDAFTPWRQTGHAEAFTQGITTNSHFGENCFGCHAVGFDRDNAGGIDNSAGYTSFLADLSAAQHANPPAIAGLWQSMLTNQPDTARLANIQCDNCHGPTDYTGVHPSTNPADISQRVSLGAEVCGSCHGEPARHGRYQQWQLSNHADSDLARRFGARANCGRCHSGNGFVAWSKQHFDPDEDLSGVSPSVETVTWNADTVVPQVCAACHDPHYTGTTSGSDETNARVRVNAYTGGTCGGNHDNPERCDTYELLAGFMATNVGKGATCMTCHNSRAEYPRNDTTWAQVVANGGTTDRPHHGPQADLIMGQNMYFTGVPVRGKHSLIEDVCVTCHMNKTLPPAAYPFLMAIRCRAPTIPSPRTPTSALIAMVRRIPARITSTPSSPVTWLNCKPSWVLPTCG